MSDDLTDGRPVQLTEHECLLLVRLLATVADGRGHDELVRDAARAGWTLLSSRITATARVSVEWPEALGHQLQRIDRAVGGCQLT